MEQKNLQGNPDKILKEHAMNSQNKTKNKPKKLTEWHKREIRKKLYNEFYMKRIPPSTKTFFRALNNDENLPNFNWLNFERVLEKLRLKPLERVGTDIIRDYGYVVIRRHDYLTKMKEYRDQNKAIYYLDEMWFDADFDRVEEDEDYTTKLVLLHIGNEHGFVADAEGFLEFETKKNKEVIKDEIFEEWFELAVQKLPANSVVVMDNVAHHRRRIDNTPDMFTPREQIHMWLREKGVQFEKDEFKIQLIDKVDKIEKKHRVYAVNEIAKKYNVELLRLHTYHIELNPIEDIWVEMEKCISRNSYDNVEDLKKLILKSIEDVSVENWKKSVERVKTMEEFYYQLDYIIDDVSDDFLDKTEGFEDDSDEPETESDY